MSNSSTHWDPYEYSSNSDIQFGITMATLASHKFNGNEAVLDAGCGDGRVSHELSRRVPKGRVVGIDSSRSMIEFAQANHALQTNLSFALKDVCELDYMNEFDVAVSAFCLQWVPDKAAAFRAIRRSLKPGGAAILVMAFRNPQIANLRKQMTRETRWKRYFVDYLDPSDCADDRQYEAYARQAGFTINSYRIEETSGSFNSIDRFANFLAALTPHLQRLPGEEDKRAFMEELVTRYLATMPPLQKKTGLATVVYVCATMIATSGPN
jgi:trans-aconitate 2-methyltransferase